LGGGLVPGEIFATGDYGPGSFITVSTNRDDSEVRDFINNSETEEIRAQAVQWQLDLERWIEAQDEKK